MNWKKYGATALLTAAFATILAACAPAIPTYSFNWAEKRITYDTNGLRVVVVPDKTTELVEVDVRYDVGSKEDPPGKAGLAHLVEHLMFQQRPDGPDQPALWDFLTQMTTFVNAFTNWDTTHYMASARKENLDSLLWLEVMRLYMGCKTITNAEFEREREVVRNEIRWRTGKPEGQISQLILNEVYPEGHPYRDMIGGDDKQLTNITLDDACTFMKKYYVPERATIVVAGNADPEQVSAVIKKSIATMKQTLANDATKAKLGHDRVNPKGAPLAEVPAIEIKKGRVEHQLDVERTSVHVAWALPPRGDKDFDAARFAIMSMTGNVASFANNWDFATQVYPQVLGGQHAQVFVISVELLDDGDVNKALDFIWKASRSAHRPFDDGVFDEPRARMKASAVMQLESLTGRTMQLADLIQFDRDDTFSSGNEYLFADLEKTDKLSGSRVRGAVKRLLNPNKATAIVIRARKDGAGNAKRANLKFSTKTHESRELNDVDPQEAYRPFPLPKNDAGVFGNAVRYELSNGMKVILAPFSSMPIASARLVFDVGSGHDPNGKSGLARTAASYLYQPMGATVYRSSGIGFNGFADNDVTVFSTSGMEIYLDVMVKGLERLIKAGEYNQRALEKFQTRQKRRLQSQSFLEGQTFAEAIASGLYGNKHPYTIGGKLTRRSIGKLNRDEVNAFRRKHYSAANATLIIAGSFDLNRAKALIRENFGSWSRGRRDKPIAGSMVITPGQSLHLGVIGRKNPQTPLRIAFPKPAGIDASTPARILLAEILSKRMNKVREQLGASYGVRARINRNSGPGAYVIGGDVDTARAPEALKAMLDELEAIRQGKGLDEDFVRARRAVISRLLGTSSVSGQISMQLANIAQFDLPSDHYTKLVREVAKLTPMHLKALITKELAADQIIIGAMADKATLEGIFAASNLSNIRYIPPNEK